MIKIYEITNLIFTSKTYILYREGDDRAWLVDIGDIDSVISFLQSKNLVVSGVFITHAHFDHIYGLEALIDRFSECVVFCTSYCAQALGSEKLNMSKYHGTPIKYTRDNIVVVRDGESMKLFDTESYMEFYETPGHNPGCLTMVLGNVIFTGDAYIPIIGVNTKLPHSDKVLAKESLERILQLASDKVIFSGH